MKNEKYSDQVKTSFATNDDVSPEMSVEQGHLKPVEPVLFDQLREKHTVPEPEQKSIDRDFPDETKIHPGSKETHADPVADESVENGSSDMPQDARRALVSLMRQGVILSSQKARLFESVCRHQTAVRRHLSEVYLKLVLDEKAGVAFVAGIQRDESAETEDMDEEEGISLINRRTLSLYDTLLLLVLRKHYQERETTGEQRIVIDIERAESNLTPFLPLTNSTRSDRKKLNAALKKMVDRKLLSTVRGSEDRYEITPVIRYIVSAEFLQGMLDEYLRLARENGVEINAMTDASHLRRSDDSGVIVDA